MEKRVVSVFLIALSLVIIFTSVANAAVNGSESDQINEGYQCLRDKIEDNERLSLQEAIFSTLALGSNQKAIDVIEGEKGSNCWPKSGCRIKDTAQVMLAYQKAGRNTQEIENWLLTKNTSTPDLQWYLQIDIANHVSSECTITYNGRENKVRIGDDMKISGTSGSCLSLSSSGYWLRISDNCISTEFTVSCNQDFLTSLLYQRKNGETVYVTSQTNSASSLGTTTEKVGAQCFRTGSACDYEGSLWATYALSKEGVEIDQFLPYLLALAEDNSKFFPSSLVYILTGNQEQYTAIVESQKQGKYWEAVASPYNRFYDTSLGMLALRSSSAAELTNAQNYLLDIQGNEGCWNNGNIRDTAFVLYAGWSGLGGSSGGGSSGNGTGPIGKSCLTSGQGYSCSKASECIEAGGSINYGFDCSNFNEFCCSVTPSVQTCQEKGGQVCSTNQQCSGTVASSSSGSCCLGTCNQIETESTCESLSYGLCRASCDSETEEQATATCSDPGLVCCAEKDTPEPTGNLWLWIIILIILIALVALGIIYRDKLRLWWFTFRGKASSSKVDRPGPGFPPAYGSVGSRPTRFGNYPVRPVMPMGNGMPQRQPVQRPITRPSSSNGKDKDLDETFKKLREMSK